MFFFCFFCFFLNVHIFDLQIECAAVGHVYHSIGGVVPGQVTPTHHQAHVRRYNKPNALPWLQQLHTEVWVATSEAGTAFIEIVDVLAKVQSAYGMQTISYPRSYL